MKEKRQRRIVELVKNRSVRTQEELVERLESEGFAAAQSTISRDIKELKLTKSLSWDGNYVYSVPEPPENAVKSGKKNYGNILKETVVSITPAKNLTVVKTYPGMAQAAGAAVDAMEISQIVGSVAGDDTLLLVFSNDGDCEAVTEKLLLLI